MSSVVKLLQNSFREIQNNPVEGILCVPNMKNFLEWTIYIEGPRDSIFEGGIFEMLMEFPSDYPMSPPALKFVSEFYHPNVYPDGKVCISILHAPGSDQFNELELPGERWMPTQTVPSIMLSVMSMLCDPNFSSPANVDASVEWRNDYEMYSMRIASIVDYTKIIHKDIIDRVYSI
eukprot:TRINITY_DN4831_c0_g1_i1.p1 TRINITY_DN4831_c0_g1~~TRINITY_DN4831_c0_g1_i1.p1  ORF type:complete len:176 (-),score=34.50 TRINITY_DN4831_c0_g1_i1:205-732(-)